MQEVDTDYVVAVSAVVVVDTVVEADDAAVAFVANDVEVVVVVFDIAKVVVEIDTAAVAVDFEELHYSWVPRWSQECPDL